MASHDYFLADHYVEDQNYRHLTIGASSLACPLPVFGTYEGSTSHFPPGIFADSYSSYGTFSRRNAGNYPLDQPATLVKSNNSPLVLCEGDIVMRNVDLFLNNNEGGHRYQLLNQGLVSNGNHGETSQPAVSHDVTLHKELAMENGSRYSRSNYMKRSRSTPIIPAEYGQDPRNKRNMKSRKTSTQKLTMSDNEFDEDGNAKGPISRSSPNSAGGHLNASQEELRGLASSSSPEGFPALNLNGKTRATRGSATDPQSLYARKRRDKINERLKTLQNLVPNGTKVDISTMLEEAVQYVKFLQLQIKLLSSDALWMYAPLAYNGMDIGLDHLRNIPAPRQ